MCAHLVSPGSGSGPAAAPAVGSAVSLRRVTRLFDGLPAITQIQLDVDRGENVWLRGTNGSGKSTLMRVIATALSPTFGEGTVLGHDLRTRRDRIRRSVDLLGHQSRLYADLTAAENLRFTATLHGLDPRLDEDLSRRRGRQTGGAQGR